MHAQKNIEIIISELKKAYPDSKTSLDFKNPFQLLVATILSGQSTDKMVNIVTPELFTKYPTSFALSKANIDELIDIIRPVGLFNNKSKNLVDMANALVIKYNGEVPNTLTDLTSLPGVGRKTATAVLANAFGITDQGITVDTHMMRVTHRLGWTTVDRKDANRVERELMMAIPQKYWGIITHLIIDHGRAICSAKNPKCNDCQIEKYCPSSQKK